jgi:site-specific DNA-methyltransferase (adenine-specific)
MKRAAVPTIDNLIRNYPATRIGHSALVNADSFEWMGTVPESSIHAIVTDPPYGVKEFDEDQLVKRHERKGGIWRLPPAFDGAARAPLPRFTAMTPKERQRLRQFFVDWSRLCVRVLYPGGHLFVATNSFLSALVFEALSEGGLEFRGQIIRLVQTLRGGDRPKNAEKEFPDVCSLPRGAFEPWGIFRKPLPPKLTVAECLRRFQTGGLRRQRDGKQLSDVIESERTPQDEKEISLHPSHKPLSLLVQLTFAALPLGKGIIADPFMGSGSTIAAAELNGLQAVGVEQSTDYYGRAVAAIPKLITLRLDLQAPLL